tara:strand:- start:10817 stop:11113 length:297 start_codon:yes stop_codon:yes gene_type:complete
MKTYCFDIDGTICTQNSTEYDSASPFLDRIDKINNLYDAGNKIIFYTARGFVTGIDWEIVTKKQLKKWNVKYHELYFGKPAADVYIDDKHKDIFEWFN